MKSKRPRRMRQRREMRLKISLRRVTWVSSTLIMLLAIGLTLFFNFSSKDEAFAAANGEYRTKASGNWNSVSTWQKYSGGSWSNATATPTSSDNIITILSGHTVTITANMTADQIVVSSGGFLVQNSGITLTLANGTGIDLSVSGTYINAGIVTISASATIVYQSSGVYQHNFTSTAGTIPSATWNSGSTCSIIGYTSNTTAPSGLQIFSNFVWNCSLQTGWINFNSGLTSLSGDFTITSTGTGGLRLSNNTASTLAVAGNFTLTSGNFSLSDGSNITSVLNVGGDYTQTVGSFSVVDGSNSTGNVNLSGNYTHTAGTLKVGGNSSTSTVVSFANAGTQNFSTTLPIVTGNVDYKINSGSTLVMGTNILFGRNFTLSSGGSLSIGSLLGITTSGLTGNIQVSGTRSYSTTADYTYTGASAQVLGNGLPATVRNLTINNGSSITLSQNTAVTGTITLTSGKIVTGTFELTSNNTSTSSIASASSTSYIIGNLRRMVSASGAYSFPLGSAAMYEPATITLSGTSGCASILGNFIASNPNDFVTSVLVSGIYMSELLNYGYWRFTPNSTITTGTHAVQLDEQGYSNIIGTSSLTSALYRANSAAAWSSVGTHSDASQIISGTTVTAVRTAMGKTLGEYAIGLGDYLAFKNPTLISGTAGAIGAVYCFPIVMRGIDAWAEITDIQGGATLSDIDNSGTGYTEAFQPFITYKANSTGYFEWKIKFKVTGTSIDTSAAKMTATGVDVDGGGSGGQTIREFIEATMPTSYALDPATTLSVTNNGGRYRATGNTTSIASIDTAAKNAMYELYYNNVSWIMYRTGAVNTQTVDETRQTSLYFRSFNLGVKNIALPIKLISFNAKIKNNMVELAWATAAEINNDYFTIERSIDGQEFEPLLTKHGAGNSTITLEYEASDPHPIEGYSYYRLKQTDYDGHFSYSEVETIKNKGGNDIDEAQIEVTSISPNPFSEEFKIDFILKEKTSVEVSMISTKGEMIFQDVVMAEDGYNSYTYTDSKGLIPGYYFVTISYKDQKVTKKILKN